jgi:predicted ester cyclase
VIDVVRFAGDKFVEHWGLMDNASMMQQLGAVPAPGMVEA